jgi:hypothetical protein
MSLKISIRKNTLPACPSPFIVRSDSSEMVEFDKFVAIMAQGRTTLSKTEILACMQLYMEELEKQLVEGRTVKTPTGSFFLCAAGSLESVDDAFLPRDPSSGHEVRLHHRPERSFEESILSRLEIVREEKVDLAVPRIMTVLTAGDDPLSALLPGGMIQVKGSRLRFDPKEARQGVFFIAQSGAEERSPFCPMIQPGVVLASLPASLPVGTYAVALRATVNGHDLREARFEGLIVGTADTPAAPVPEAPASPAASS